MLQASFSIVDQIRIGQLGEAGIAAVGLFSKDVYKRQAMNTAPQVVSPAGMVVEAAVWMALTIAIRR